MKTLPNKNILKEIPMFSELSSAQLNNVTAIGEIKKFKKNQILFHTDELYRGFYILLEGTVKVFKLSKDGKETILHLVKPSQVFADIPLFEGKNYPVSAQALEESELLFFESISFIQMLEHNSKISLKMLSGFAKRMKQLTQKIEELSSKEVTSRLAEYILQEIKNSGTEKLPEPFIKLTVSKTAIAGYLGTITETLSRALKKLQDEKIIRVQGKKIFVGNYKKLKTLAG